MKKICLVFMVVFLSSCVSNSVNKDRVEQTIIVMTNSGNLLPDVRYKITFNDGKTKSGKSNGNGLIILKAANLNDYEIKLDFEPAYSSKKEIKEFYDVFTDEDVESFEIVHLKHQTDTEIITYIEKHKLIEIEHGYGCYNDEKYNTKLENGKNYVLIYPARRMQTISM